MQPLEELLERVDARGVERCHVAQAEDHYVSKLREVRGGLGELVRRSEEKGAVDAEDGYICGDVLVLKNVGLAVLKVLRSDGGDRRCFRDAVNVEECGERHTYTDGHREVGENG